VGKDGPKRSRFLLGGRKKKTHTHTHTTLFMAFSTVKKKQLFVRPFASGWFTHSPVSCLPFSITCMSCTILSSIDYISVLKQEALYSSVTLALTYKNITLLIITAMRSTDCLCGLVVRVSGYRSRGPGFRSCPTRFSEK
jgi:hypothetical protein